MLQTMMSNGVGASVGLEGGYTQIGAAIASRFGRSFRLRRNDMRVLVGCGAAGAIGSAFHAPLTGAFYAFELIIGTYTLATFAPVAVASIVAYSVLQVLGGSPFDLDLQRTDANRGGRLHPAAGARHGVRAGRHRHHARRHADRGAVPPQPRAGLAAPGLRRRRPGRDGAGHARGAVLRPRRAGHRASTRPTRCRTSPCCSG